MCSVVASLREGSNLQSPGTGSNVAARAFPRVVVPLHGEVRVPGSKSVSNRALVCAALANGPCAVSGLAEGDDTARMVAGLATLGAEIDVAGTTARVGSAIERSGSRAITLDAGLAGTTSRFLTAVAALCEYETTVTGAEALLRRPMGELHRLLREMGVVVTSQNDGRLPVTVSRGTSNPTGERVLEARGDVSSQFVSAVMMIAPLSGGIRLRLSGPVVSAGYLDMTADVMHAFGASVRVRRETSGTTVWVDAGDYRATTFVVDADWSSSSYPFAAIGLVGGEVLVPHLRTSSSQPEVAFAGVLERMGCTVHADESGVRVSRDPDHRLCGVDVDMAEISDLVPTLAVLGACAEGTTRIRGVGFIRAKESDRLGDLASELRKCGVDVSVADDGLDVRGGSLQAASIEPHHDHRLAMSLALLGMCRDGIEVRDPDVVSKSWPSFWTSMQSGLGIG